MAQEKLSVVVELEDRASRELRGVNSRMKNLNRTTDKASKSLGGLDSAFKKVAGTVGGFLAFDQLSQFVGSAIDEFAAFEKEMRRVNTVAQVSEERFQRMADGVEELSTQVPISAKKIASGLFDVASAGISAKNQMAFLTEASKFATAGFTDVSTAVKGMTAAMKGFNLAEREATRIANLFFKANELGQTTIEEMSKSLQRMTSSAQKAGVGIEQTMATFATLTGVTGNAAEVSTQFRGAMNAIAAPTQGAAKTAQKLNKQLAGTEVRLGKTAFESKNLAEVSRTLWKAVDKDAQKLRELIPEIEAGDLVISLATSQFDKFNDSLREMENSSKAMEEAFSEAMDSVANKQKLASNNLKILKKDVGEAIVPIKLLGTQFLNSMNNAAKIIVESGRQLVLSLGSVVNTVVKILGRAVQEGLNNVIEGFEKAANFISDRAADLGMEKVAEATEANFGRIEVVTQDTQDIIEEAAERSKIQWEGFLSKLGDIVITQDELEARFRKSQIANAAKNATKKTKGLAEQSGTTKKKIIEAFDKMTQKADMFAGTLQDALSKTEERIDSIQKKINEAQLNRAKTFQSVEEKRVAAFLDAQERIKEIKRGGIDEEERTELKQLEGFVKGKEQVLKATARGELNRQRQRRETPDAILTFKDTQKTVREAQNKFEKRKEALEKELEAEKSTREKLMEIRKQATQKTKEFVSSEEEFTLQSVNRMIQAYNKLAKAVKRARSGKQTGTVSLDQTLSQREQIGESLEVPEFAKGGIIKGSSTGTLIRAGEQNKDEAIVPLDRGGKMGDTVVNIHWTGAVDDRAAERVGDKIIDKLSLNSRFSIADT